MNAQLQAVISTPPQLTLTAQQSAALTAMLAFARGEHGARMMTLEGYAGTGKTTLVGELLRITTTTKWSRDNIRRSISQISRNRKCPHARRIQCCIDRYKNPEVGIKEGMIGLCHTCLGTNKQLLITDGSITCTECNTKKIGRAHV